jgi:hypothetical protein
MLMVDVKDDDTKGWSKSRMQNTGDGLVHGPWGGNEAKSVEKTFQLPKKAQQSGHQGSILGY